MKSLIKKELLITIFFVISGLTLGQGLKSKGSMGAGLPGRATLARKEGNKIAARNFEPTATNNTTITTTTTTTSTTTKTITTTTPRKQTHSGPDFGQEFNLTSAECFNLKATAEINLFKEWSAFHEDGSDGFCYDNLGTGYGANQKYISCGGCMKFNCTSRPCDDRDGSKFKLYWVLESIGTECCQNCEAQVFPPNSAVSNVNLGDNCQTVEHAICKTNIVSTGSVGAIEVSYTSGNCCGDKDSLAPAGTTIVEKDTCSHRTCVEGRPAQWERETKFKGGCGCCEYNSTLLLPGECRTVLDGTQACCCDGEMVKELYTTTTTTTTTSTTTTTPTTTTTSTTKTTTPTTTPNSKTTTATTITTTNTTTNTTTQDLMKGDPQCAREYKVLDEDWRKINYGVKHNEANCDDELNPGWYRFKFDEKPYAKIPTTVPEEEHRQKDMQSCGTHGVSWMSATSLPTIGQRAKETTIYFAFKNWEIDERTSVKVVACGEGDSTVYLYYLNPVSGCDRAYCAL